MQIVHEYRRLVQARSKPSTKGAAKSPTDPPAAKAAGAGGNAPALGPDGLPAVPDPLAAKPSGRPEDPPYPAPPPSTDGAP